MELTFGVIVIRAYNRCDANHLCIDHFQHSVVNLKIKSIYINIIIIVVEIIIYNI